jgi:[acyl-carrier-protein] S-malonyltransferase
MISVPFLFPGQLSEYSGMGRDFYEADPEARALFEETSRRCGRDFERILFSEDSAELHENLAAQAGVYLVSTLACRALAREGIRPAATAGYSLGNYAAFVAAGAVSYEEGLDVLVAVWRETERLGVRGAMGAIIGCRREIVEEVCGQLRERGLPVWIGNVNSSTQFIVTGSEEAVRSALQTLAPRALSVLPLSMSWPIHSELMEPVARAVAPIVENLASVRDPEVPFYGPDGTVARKGDQVRRLLATEFLYPTLWNATFEAMIADGFRTFLEVGPGEMLGRMSRWIDRSVTVHAAGTVEAISKTVDILRGERS